MFQFRFFYLQYYQVTFGFMSWQPKMYSHWFHSVHLAWLECSAHVCGIPVGEEAALTIATLTHIGWDNVDALASILEAPEHVDSLVSAGDGDFHCAGLLGRCKRRQYLDQCVGKGSDYSSCCIS